MWTATLLNLKEFRPMQELQPAATKLTNQGAATTTAGSAQASLPNGLNQRPILQYRTVNLQGIKIPVRVEHEKLDQSERLDSKTSRVDILEVWINVTFEYSTIRDYSFEKIWNYSEVYKLLCEGDIPVLTGPLETLLDKTIDVITQSAKAQDVVIVYAEINAKRIGLAVGCPVLRRTVGRKFDPVVYHANMRSAGVCALPLSLRVDHSWAQEAARIEHKDVRSEVLSVSFDVFTRARPLCSESLRGLMNYVSTVEMLDQNQNSLIDQPGEYVVDLVTKKIEDEVRRNDLELCALSVQVERNGYARLTPTLGVLCVY